MKKLAQAWHVVGKSFSFLVFGLGGLGLSFAIFPLLWILVHPRRLRTKVFRALISAMFRVFVWMMSIMGIIRVRWANLKQLKTVRGMVVVANHPTLLDVVIVIAYLPKADCIVKSKLWANPFVRFVVSSVYIPNSLDSMETVQLAVQSVHAGNNLVIFPEGTRSKKGVLPKIHRSAAQIACRSGRPILPIRIDIPDPRGLGKGDSLFASPENGKLDYRLTILEPLVPEKTSSDGLPAVARTLTQNLHKCILPSI